MESAQPVRFACLVPPGQPRTAAAWLDGLDPVGRIPDDRPHVALNMISSVDGRATSPGTRRGSGTRGTASSSTASGPGRMP